MAACRGSGKADLDAKSAGHILDFLAKWMAEGRITCRPETVREVLRHLVFVEGAAGHSQSESSFVQILQHASQASPEQYQNPSGDHSAEQILNGICA